VRCATGDEVQAAFNAKGDRPLIVVLTGTIDGANTKAAQIDISGKHDWTIMADGVGQDVAEVGFRVNKGSSNGIFFNLKAGQAKEGPKDVIGIEGDCHHIVVLHCDLAGDMAKGKDYYDGLLDTKRGSHSIAAVLCKFHDHHKACLQGYSDSDKGDRRVTFALCHWDKIGSRCPSVRYGEAHVWGCLLTDVETSGINCRMGAKVCIEATTFDKVHNPVCALDSKEPGYWNIIDSAAMACSWGKPSAKEPLAVDMKSKTDFRPPYAMPAITRGQAAAVVQQGAGLLPPGVVLALPGHGTTTPQPEPEQPAEPVTPPQPSQPEAPTEEEPPKEVDLAEVAVEMDAMETGFTNGLAALGRLRQMLGAG
jgi:pectate lyase